MNPWRRFIILYTYLLIGSNFIFEPCILILNLSIAIFLLLCLDWICSKVYILASYCFYGEQWLKIPQSKGYARLAFCCLKMETASFWNMILSTIRRWTKSPKKTMSFNVSDVVLSLFDWLTFEDRTDRLSWNISKELPLYAA